MIQIVDLLPDDKDAIAQVVEMMQEGFKHFPDFIEDEDDALEEIAESHEEGRISLMAVNEDGFVLGWVGGRHNYERVWELHPMIVRSSHQRRGIGRMLVTALEQQVAAQGGMTLVLGTDDIRGDTSIGGIDLYPNIGEHIANIRNLREHPFGFYQKLGYTIYGLLPDANGFGQPDILMAKRVSDA